MHRLSKFALAALVALTITACDEGEAPPVDVPPPPTPVGTISGTVTIDGTGATGITATLSSGATTATGAGGTFSFAGVEAGSYTVTISGFPADAAFPSATQAATIASDGQTVQLNFAGEYIRSSSVVGNVVAADPMMMGSDSNGDGRPDMLDGITVTLEGEHTMAEPQSTMEGGFAFTGLRAGSYTVTISGYPDDVKFETPSMTVEVGVGDVGMANFEGAYIRTAAVEGRVIIEGEGLAGVTVTLTGGPGNDNYTKLTGDDGGYAFTELRPGDYQISISGYDPDDYDFASSSHDVSVDLGETEIVSFTGVLLRTSGVSGRVSVEGMGLADIAVTLSGAADATTMTDASGQYAFSGLAAGDYSVSIAVESAAYVFESMSSDVTVGDDDSQIVNFEGSHATTASVSGMLFIDELDNNDAYDEGENALAAAGVPVALVGPGVNDQRLSATNADGQFMFSDLRAGPYQLIVPITADVAAALAAKDLAYGGPATGYGFELGVGEAKTQAVPFDITHTTINVAVTLKGGEHRGMPIPGASVTLYSDAAGETKVGSGETEVSEAGVFTSIRVTRAGTSDNTVHMAVSTEGYFVDPTAGMQAVTWNPQSTVHPAPDADPPAVLNDANIVNLNVDVSVSGATVTTEYGGGDALAGWAIAVLSGSDPTSLTPVEGAPAMLDEDGNAAFTATVAPDALPAAFAIAVAPDQADAMDGGENYAAEPATYVHTGLMLAGTQDAGTIEVAYTTQTLKVYVHHERDQVEGYTGNVLGGDERDTAGRVDVKLRYIDDSGRSRAFQSSESIDSNGGNKGAWVFSNVPADMNVVVQAEDGQNSEAEGYQAIMLLDEGGHSDELAAHTGTEANGITGGHFGAQGGYSHTVELCPLQATNPQDHGECSSFAYVETHTVSGLVWRASVAKQDDDEGFDETDPDFSDEVTVGLTPVEGKNLAGEEQSFNALAKPSKSGETDDHAFTFEDVAAGAYKVTPPTGWRVMTPKAGEETKGATGDVGNALNPLDGDVALDITPATATVYGFIVDEDGFAMESATVTANAESTLTDEHGRFILEGISSETRKVNKNDVTGIFVETSVAGVGKASVTLTFAANSVTKVVDANGDDLQLTAADATASISGTVRASGTAAAVAGAEVKVSYDDGATFEAPQDLNAKSKGATKNNIYVTGPDGTYTAMVRPQQVGEGVAIRVTKDGMSFVPAEIDDIPAHAGSSVSGFDFTGFVHARITGRVVAAGGGPMSGVTVTATEAGVEDAEETDSDVTGRTGTFVLSVPFDRYTIAASAGDGSLTRFTYPDDEQDVRVAPGQRVSFGDIKGASVAARSITAARQKNADGNYDDDVIVTMAFDTVAGFTGEQRDAQSSTDGGETWSVNISLVQAPDIPGSYTFDVPADAGDGAFHIRIETTATENTVLRTENSAAVMVGAVSTTASDVEAERSVGEVGGVDEGDDLLTIAWDASTNASTLQRVVMRVEVSAGRHEWLVAEGALGNPVGDEVRAWALNITDFDAGSDTSWELVDGSGSFTVSTEALLKALTVRVETKQPGVTQDEDGDDIWVASSAVTVDAEEDG